jgi:hypothetical protein
VALKIYGKMIQDQKITCLTPLPPSNYLGHTLTCSRGCLFLLAVHTGVLGTRLPIRAPQQPWRASWPETPAVWAQPQVEFS